MTTEIRPKSSKDWKDEVPSCIQLNGTFATEFNSALYLTAAGARIGWEKKRLSITEQTLVMAFREICHSLATEDNLAGQLLRTVPLNAEVEHLRPGQISVCLSLAKMVLSYAYIANANPEVGHFVGQGAEQNNRNADQFLDPNSD